MYNAYPFSSIRIIETSTSIVKTLHNLILTYNNHVTHVLKINYVSVCTEFKMWRVCFILNNEMSLCKKCNKNLFYV